MTIVEFLTARLDEDEAAARQAQAYIGKGIPGPTDSHTVRQSPDHALREVAAKRDIISLYRSYTDGGLKYDEGADFHADGLEEAIRALASAHSNHPDYDPKWSV